MKEKKRRKKQKCADWAFEEIQKEWMPPLRKDACPICVYAKNCKKCLGGKI